MLTTNLTKTIEASVWSHSFLIAADSRKFRSLLDDIEGSNLNFLEKIESNALYMAENYDELLCWATEKSQVKIVKYLLEEKGANANALCKNGVPPLFIGYYNNNIFDSNLDIVRLLFEHGANQVLYRPDFGISIHLIQFAVCYGDIKLVKFLINEKQICVNALYHDGSTLLHIAAQSAYEKNDGNYDEIIKFLLEKKADTKIKDVNNQIPLDIAIERGHKQIVSLLEKKN